MIALEPPRACIDCRDEGSATSSRPRPAPYPGPRCYSHDRAVTKARKRSAAERRDSRVYGLPPGGYDALMAIQGGTCAICQRAKGIRRRLSVDHDHKTLIIRGLLCSICNTMLGHARDNEAFFLRAIAYLRDPPAQQLGNNQP